jgi:hypothetical protein
MNVPKKLVRSLVLHFAELAGFDGSSYTVTLDRGEYERIQRRRSGGDLPAKDEDFGITLTSHPVVTWINLPRHRSWRQLVDTCAHEALHAARPEMRHGADYEAAVRRLLMEREP